MSSSALEFVAEFSPTKFRGSHYFIVFRQGLLLSLTGQEILANTPPEFVGLERYMKQLRRDKEHNIFQTTRSIPQATVFQNEYWDDDDEVSNCALDASWNEENVRWHGERVSLSSRLFAFYMATAQRAG